MASSPEEAVVQAALQRGFLSAPQVAAARGSATRPGELLPLLSRSLSPGQRDQLKAVYAAALRAKKVRLLDPGEAERLAAAAIEAPPQVQSAQPGPALAATVAMPSGGAAGSPAAPPRQIAGHELLRELGRGGMGLVYEARSLSLGRKVALKVLLTGDEANDEAVARFQVEARAAARLRHPNVVRLLEHGQDDQGRWYMAMDLIEGESLEERIVRDGPLPPSEAARIVRDLARALEYAHGESVLHRDLKPHNILLDGAGQPLVTDFGLAKLVGDAAKSLTASGGGPLGTPAYMAPEQAGGERKRVDERADVYGLGATLYRALTGAPPFDGDTLANVLVAVLSKEPPAPRSLRPALPQDLETICLKCLEKEPADRYATAAEVAEDLERFLASRAIVARPPGAAKRAQRWIKRHRLPVAVGAGALLVLAVGGLFARQQIERARRARLSSERLVAAERNEADRKAAASERAAEDARAKLRRLAAEKEDREREVARLKAERARRKTEAPVARPVERKTSQSVETKTPEPVARKTELPEQPPEKVAPLPVAPVQRPKPKPAAPGAKDVALKPVPAWLKRRVVLQSLRDRRLIHWATGWRDGLAEARRRNAPLLVVQLDPDLLGVPPMFRDAGVVRAINEGFVALIGQRLKKEEHKTRAGMCLRFGTISCDQHEAVRSALKKSDKMKKAGLPPDDDLAWDDKNDWRAVVCGPQGNVLSQTRRGVRSRFLGMLKQALRRHRPAAPFKALIKAARLLLAGDAALERDDVKKALRSYLKVKRPPSPLKPWWENRTAFLAQRCRRAIASAPSDPDRRAQVLGKLRRIYRQHPACRKAIERALAKGSR